MGYAARDFADKVRSYEKPRLAALVSFLALKTSREISARSERPVQKASLKRSFRG
jgi:hypothetical protein